MVNNKYLLGNTKESHVTTKEQQEKRIMWLGERSEPGPLGSTEKILWTYIVWPRMTNILPGTYKDNRIQEGCNGREKSVEKKRYSNLQKWK